MAYAIRVIVALALLVGGSRTAFAIREFDIRTIERLGRKLYEKSQQSSSSQSEQEQHVVRSAKDALKGVDLRGYRFVGLARSEGLWLPCVCPRNELQSG